MTPDTELVAHECVPPRRSRRIASSPTTATIMSIANKPGLDTTERVFRKVWEMACYAGFSYRA